MKKLLLFAFLLSGIVSFAQGNAKQNEVKLNILNVIAFKWLDVSYQRNLNEESSVGFSVLTRLSDENTRDFNRSFSFTPYYRYFILNEESIGFFGEVHTKINSGDKEIETEVARAEGDVSYEKYTDLSIGLGGGLRFVSPKGFTAEAYAGAGRNMFTKTAPTVVTRFGVSVGYSF